MSKLEAYACLKLRSLGVPNAVAKVSPLLYIGAASAEALRVTEETADIAQAVIAAFNVVRMITSPNFHF